jgi:hypothetical protein
VNMIGLLWWCSFGLVRRVDWLVEADVSEKRAVCILRASLKRRLLPTGPHGALTQKNISRMVTAMTTLSPTWIGLA